MSFCPEKTPDDTIEIDLDLDELDITSAESKATYQEIKDYVLKEFGLKACDQMAWVGEIQKLGKIPLVV